ncbi:hypothetical protein Avbf_13273 [Armadillidium vulgare]|nr:hypothetical protein Avbf_13273 [Armadillidium vulgare]
MEEDGKGKNRMLGVTGTTWEDMGSMRWDLVGCLALAWIIICALHDQGCQVIWESCLFFSSISLLRSSNTFYKSNTYIIATTTTTT